MNGEVGILNVGAGDTKLSFDKRNPKERERAAKIVADMLKQGYALLVQVGKKNGEPIYQRAKRFDPKTCEYIVAGGPDEDVQIGKEDHGTRSKAETNDKTSAGATRGRLKRVPAESTRSVAVARTAGG